MSNDGYGKYEKSRKTPFDGSRAAKKLLGLTEDSSVTEQLDGDPNDKTDIVEMASKLIDTGSGRITFEPSAKSVQLLCNYWLSWAVQRNPAIVADSIVELEGRKYPYTDEVQTESILPFVIDPNMSNAETLDAILRFATHASEYSIRAEESLFGKGTSNRVDQGVCDDREDNGCVVMRWDGTWTEGRYIEVRIHENLSSEIDFNSATGRRSRALGIKDLIQESKYLSDAQKIVA